ncbi:MULTISPECIES: phosphogluconate dehydratase [unclassified Iodidimonas]|jgi:phosphogluconate dehydratase|uniref:phosphogluconate dehydratase n=1 Tax=unclassified Iodidimonas TaxID=2626145 RepID=UPI002482EE92|nr:MULTISPECIES: phosphogluconate dehydratase [unclassified Iodidimonas]
MVHDTLQEVTTRIRERSLDRRTDYLERIEAARQQGPNRGTLSCGNLAHGFAAAEDDKPALKADKSPNIAIVSSYNDMLSAHQPYQRFPNLIKLAAREVGATAQFAGGVPAMCDGVTQGQDGMELSLFSRDIIAQATAIALSHNMFDSVLALGICDKIVPGLMIGALSFGHLPTIFVPGGPMPSGLPNNEKSRIRGLYAEGKATRDDLLEAESQSYHSPGTCTFYGTANSNQMMMEMMGVHLPGSAFIHPNTKLRDALTAQTARRAAAITALGNAYTPLGRVIDERAIVNAIVGLMATGGSTNHTLHLVAIARAAGIELNWTDFADLSAVVPLLTRIYPNGSADVNHFHAAGGIGFLIRELVDAGLLHGDIETIHGVPLSQHACEPMLDGDKLVFKPAPLKSGDPDVLRGVDNPFSATGGLVLVQGNLGRSVIKVSAVAPEHRAVKAPARVFHHQNELGEAFKRGELERDFVAVVRYQGPRANGMPELHKMTPVLGLLQERGYKVALITDGRMSGASGKVPAAIHLTPEALDEGPIARIRDGDIINLDAEAGRLDVEISEAELLARPITRPDLTGNRFGMGRDLFGAARHAVNTAEEGASFILS